VSNAAILLSTHCHYRTTVILALPDYPVVTCRPLARPTQNIPDGGAYPAALAPQLGIVLVI